MDYTTSNAYATHGGTGHRMHQQSAPVTTAVDAKDLNQVIWGLMKLLEDAGISAATFDADTPATYNRVSLAVQALAAAGAPAGQVAAFASTGAPTGWLVCNGSAVSRTTYARLFTAIGTTWGVGDGSTTFNLPDLRGEFVRGADQGRGIDSGRAVGTWQDWGTGRPKVATPSRINGDGTTGALTEFGGGAIAGGTSAIGFVRASRTGETVTSGSWDSNGSGTEMDIWQACTGDPETRPRNQALLYCIRT